MTMDAIFRNRTTGHRRLPVSLSAVALGTATLCTVVALPSANAAQAAGTSAKVVTVVTRAPVGKMLATTKGASLYTSSASCTASCLTVWPPLVMPAGKTVPTGIKGLATKKLTLGGKHDLQVTYLGKALYRFSGDSGTSLNGNGLGTFKAAVVG